MKFRSVAVAAGAIAALALSAALVFGNLVERRRDRAVLIVIGWKRRNVRRQIAAELAFQGLLGAVLALVLVAISTAFLSQVNIVLPMNLPGENPAKFAAGGFHAGTSSVALPISITIWDWLPIPFIATLASGTWGWWMSSSFKMQALWFTMKGS